MTKKQLNDYINLYKEVEKSFQIDHKQFPFNVITHYHERYNYIIHKLLDYQFGYENADFLEHYIWEQTNLSFEELCKKLNIEDETN